MSAITDRLSIIANRGMKSGIPVHVINMMQQSRETVQMANDSQSLKWLQNPQLVSLSCHRIYCRSYCYLQGKIYN